MATRLSGGYVRRHSSGYCNMLTGTVPTLTKVEGGSNEGELYLTLLAPLVHKCYC
jgi:hypothetical protein